MAQNMAAMQTFFTPSGKGDDRTRTIVYKDGGELKAAQVNDPLLWKAIGEPAAARDGPHHEDARLPAQTLRAGVVLDPTFMVRNFVRDTLSATVQSKGSFIPVLSTAAGHQGDGAAKRRLQAVALVRRLPSPTSSSEPEEAARDHRAHGEARRLRPGSSIISPVRLARRAEEGRLLHRVGLAHRRIRGDLQAGRLRERAAGGASTAARCRPTSACAAATRDAGLDAHHAVHEPGDAGPLQDRARALRRRRQGGGKAAMIGAGMALASVALALANSDEDWYQRIEEWEKATYWHFKLGGNVWRIPKPFEYGMFFASIPEAIALRERRQGNERGLQEAHAAGALAGDRSA
jgi:hypothetical protein